MTTHTIYELGQLYRALSDVVYPQGNGDAAYANALHHPLAGVMQLVNRAHQLRVMDDILDHRCMELLDNFTEDDVAADYSGTGLTLSEQGTFALGYAKGFA